MDEPVFSRAFLQEYEIVDELGSGGMARVYRARQRSLDRVVALKLLSPQAFTEEDSRKRFEEEKLLASQLKHPNVVPLLSFGEDSGRPFLVFEFIDGKSLRALLNEKKQLDARDAAHIARDIASGLSAAHKKRIVHRDLKPDNILLDRRGVAKITDFGLARSERADRRLTQAGIILGTPGYLAPEVIRGQPATPSSDLFSLGVLLYEMLTGELPFAGSTDRELLVKYCREDCPPPSQRGALVPPALDQLALSLTAREAQSRPRDADRVVKQIDEMQSQLATVRVRQSLPGTQRVSMPNRPPSASDPGPAAQTKPFVRFWRRHRLALVAVTISLALAASAAGGLYWYSLRLSQLEARIIDEPVVSTGPTSALIRWKTDVDQPTCIWLWADGQNETEGRAQELPSGSRSSRKDHELLVRRLLAGTRHFYRVVFADGRRSSRIFTISKGPDPTTLMSPVQARFVDPDSIEVTFTNHTSLPPGVLLRGSDGTVATTWSESPSSGKHRMRVRLPGRKIFYDTSVRLKGLDEEDGVPGPRVGGYDIQRQAFVEAMVKPENRVPGDLIDRILGIPVARFKAVARTRSRTGEKLVAALSAGQKQEIAAEAAGMVDGWLRQAIRIDGSLLSSLVRLWFADTGIPAVERHQVYTALGWLSDLDGTLEFVTGGPLLDVETLVRPFIPITRDAPIPAEGFRPLRHLPFEVASQVARDYYVCIPTRLYQTQKLDSPLMTFVTIPRERLHEARRYTDEMLAPDPADPSLPRGPWFRLGAVTNDLRLADGLKLHLRLSSIDPSFRVWLRFGKDRLFFVRHTLSRTKGFVPVSADPAKDTIEKESSTVSFSIPPGVLAETDRDLSVHIENFSVLGPDPDPALHVVWLVDLVLTPGR